MPVLQHCPTCGKPYRIPSTHMGRAVRCTQCGGEFTAKLPANPGAGAEAGGEASGASGGVRELEGVDPGIAVDDLVELGSGEALPRRRGGLGVSDVKGLLRRLSAPGLVLIVAGVVALLWGGAAQERWGAVLGDEPALIGAGQLPTLVGLDGKPVRLTGLRAVGASAELVGWETTPGRSDARARLVAPVLGADGETVRAVVLASTPGRWVDDAGAVDLQGFEGVVNGSLGARAELASIADAVEGLGLRTDSAVMVVESMPGVARVPGARLAVGALGWVGLVGVIGGVALLVFEWLRERVPRSGARVDLLAPVAVGAFAAAGLAVLGPAGVALQAWVWLGLGAGAAVLALGWLGLAACAARQGRGLGVATLLGVGVPVFAVKRWDDAKEPLTWVLMGGTVMVTAVAGLAAAADRHDTPGHRALAGLTDLGQGQRVDAALTQRLAANLPEPTTPADDTAGAPDGTPTADPSTTTDPGDPSDGGAADGDAGDPDPPTPGPGPSAVPTDPVTPTPPIDPPGGEPDAGSGPEPRPGPGNTDPSTSPPTDPPTDPSTGGAPTDLFPPLPGTGGPPVDEPTGPTPRQLSEALPPDYQPYFESEERFVGGYGFFVPEGLDVRAEEDDELRLAFGPNELHCLVTRRVGEMLASDVPVTEGDDGRMLVYVGRDRMRLPRTATVESVTVSGLAFSKISLPTIGDRVRVYFTAFDGERCVTFHLTSPSQGDEAALRKAVLEAAVYTLRRVGG